MTGCNKPWMQKLAFWNRGKAGNGTIYSDGYYADNAALRGKQGEMTPELRSIYFAYDSSSLLSQAGPSIDQNAAWIRQNPGNIQIQGNCDARGTADYNYALGQRRAESVRQALISRGVDGSRLNTISYGADRPAQEGTSEEAYARNRRADFMVYGR